MRIEQLLRWRFMLLGLVGWIDRGGKLEGGEERGGIGEFALLSFPFFYYSLFWEGGAVLGLGWVILVF